jgi:cell division protein FtsW
MSTTTIKFGRTDTSTLGRWWWTVDRWTFAALFLLIMIGAFLTMAASPAVAERIGADSFHFIRKHFIFGLPSLALIVIISLQNPLMIRRIATIGFLGALALTAATLMIGAEIKGATRWLNLPGMTIQPSEFLKPTFAVVTAWMFAEQKRHDNFPGNLVAMALFGIVIMLLLAQPDVGMTLIVAAVWFAQFFLAGLQIFWVVLLGALGIAGIVGAYFAFPHVALRVDRFLDPSSGDAYQITTALNAFKNGGLFGRGPGEGRVKLVLPDAHTDFILAVAGEEFGVIACLIILMIFAFIVLRGMARMLHEENLFIVLATSGLLVQFGLQAIVNMASTLRLMPTKGMTLPFISYGGSSMLALALGMGMVLALTRRRVGPSELK